MKREYWLDYAKLFACVLVVLGHLFQSFAKTGLIDSVGTVYTTFDGVIYLFHVPIFFFCSGYLYQKFTKVKDYCKNIWKKFLNLGVPYFTFTAITLGLKSLAANNIASPVEYDFFSTMFLHSTSPYRFLYTLFFIFLFTTAINESSKYRSAAALVIYAVLLKTLGIALDILGVTGMPFFVSSVLDNIIWFIFGMICVFKNLLRFANFKIATGSLLFLRKWRWHEFCVGEWNITCIP